MPSRLLLALAAALLIIRLPSLVQPMGPDQALYAYVGERILHGELPYRDAWDQKPPGVHYIYAALRALSKSDAIVPAADLAAAAVIAALLWTIGSRLCGPLAGPFAAVLFLLLSDPYLARYAGFRVRAQAETFIALAVTAAIAIAVRHRRSSAAEASGALVAGVLVGCAFALKYNAAPYGAIVLAAMMATGRLTWRNALLVVAGAAIVPAALLLVFWRGGALDALYQATIAYNLRYSGETYAGPGQLLRYIAIAPVRHAQLDPLWFVGGVGCLVMLIVSLRALMQRRLVTGWIPIAWVAVACASIAINGSRDLPQYFLQAAPALALAAGMAGAVAIPPLPVAMRWIVLVALAAATWRVGADPFPKLASNVWQDTRYALGKIDRRTHLARYGARDIDKYSALGNHDLGDVLGARTTSADTVYVFGYSSGAYVYAERRSASRFFWSRPIILGFHSEDAAYSVNGLHADLERQRPKFVVLQERDWAPAEARFSPASAQDSAPFFHAQPVLDGWLRANYRRVEPFVEGFEGWERTAR